MIAAAALDTLPRGMNGELRQLLFFMSGRESAAGWGRRLFKYALHQLPEMGRPASISRRSPTKTPSILSGSGMSLSG